jgi:hypothetical protein
MGEARLCSGYGDPVVSYGLRPASGQLAGVDGDIDYRLARDAVVREYRDGQLSRLDVCDAQPELMRAARNLGEKTARDCPICDEAKVVLVSYVFGPRLPSGGRCLSSPAELSALSRRRQQIACYVVEVCPECSWNHLARIHLLGGQRP